MQRRKSRYQRDPYFYVKLLNIIIACAVILLTVLYAVLDIMPAFTRSIIFLLGMIMCAVTGIMELSKNDRLIGYVCSVLSGIMVVALILTIIIPNIW